MTVTARVYVSLERAILGNYDHFGAVEIDLDLSKLDEEDKRLLIDWGSWEQTACGMCLVCLKREWASAEAAREGRSWSRGIEARSMPPTIDDVLHALRERRDREPENMRFEQIAVERRRREKEVSEKVPAKKRGRFWSWLVCSGREAR